MRNVKRYMANVPYTRPNYSNRPLTFTKSDRLRQAHCYRLFRLGADQTINKLPVLEYQHGGNAVDLIFRSSDRILIHIQLGNAIAPLRFRGQLLHDWSNHATRRTPLSPTV